jgi:hypothetical protein
MIFADLLALDVAVDAGHPRVDLVHQEPLAQPLDGPVGDARRRWPRCASGPALGKAGADHDSVKILGGVGGRDVARYRLQTGHFVFLTPELDHLESCAPDNAG